MFVEVHEFPSTLQRHALNTMFALPINVLGVDVLILEVDLLTMHTAIAVNVDSARTDWSIGILTSTHV